MSLLPHPIPITRVRYSVRTARLTDRVFRVVGLLHTIQDRDSLLCLPISVCMSFENQEWDMAKPDSGVGELESERDGIGTG